MSGGGNGVGRSAVNPNAGKRQGNNSKAVGNNGRAGNKGKVAPASAREIALDIMVKVEQQGAYSNLLLNSSLQKATLSKEDAGLVTELVYGSISRMNTLDYVLEGFVSKGIAKLQPWVRNLLRLSLYQIMYLDRIPSHAAVNEAVNIAKKKATRESQGWLTVCCAVCCALVIYRFCLRG